MYILSFISYKKQIIYFILTLYSSKFKFYSFSFICGYFVILLYMYFNFTYSTNYPWSRWIIPWKYSGSIPLILIYLNEMSMSHILKPQVLLLRSLTPYTLWPPVIIYVRCDPSVRILLESLFFSSFFKLPILDLNWRLIFQKGISRDF